MCLTIVIQENMYKIKKEDTRPWLPHGETSQCKLGRIEKGFGFQVLLSIAQRYFWRRILQLSQC